MAIPPKLYKQLRAALLDCGPFATAAELNTIFVEKRLSPWRNRLPETNSQTGRVESIIDFLYHQYNAVGRNALVLLLHVLSERLDSGDACYHRLAHLADELECEVKKLIFPRDKNILYQTSKEYKTSKLSLAKFQTLMIKHFNESELHDLCFDLGIAAEILPGRGKAAKVRELIAYCQRYHRLEELVKKCKEERPSVIWEA